jgi:cold shock CspA family protein
MGADTFTGVVASFDEERGIGSVRAEAGEEHFFHCTAILDGSRTIAEGAEVTFKLVAGHRGQWEATDLAPVD